MFMLIQSQDMHNLEELKEVEVRHMGYQLLSLVDFYYKYLPIDTPETKHRLDMLHDIGTAIVNRDYHLLINDPSTIKNDTEMTVEEYQETLFESMADQHYSGKPF